MNRSQLPSGTLSSGTLPKEAIDRSLGFTVKFWGVRGDIPTPGFETLRYGGNTACVEMCAGGKHLIFDGGTGLRALGKSLIHEAPVQAHLFFTHTHWDRIQGFPFFVPAFHPGNRFDIYGAVGANGASIKQRLYSQMLRPHFPTPIQTMRSHLQFHDIAPGSVIELDDVVVEAIALNRSNGALGYRVTWNGYSAVYATDIETSIHTSVNQVDQGLLYLAHHADLLIYDAAQVTGSQPNGCDQLSSVWSTGVEIAMLAQAKQLALFHHDSDYTDDFLDRVELEAQKHFPNAGLAREGLTIQLVTAGSHLSHES
ncbi:MAG: MBL fold metallo-hydrolase [Drouetiella hepatica Uher 2000/2452]|uniref:MBL fold metallo-hydrolase n=1 Tax=Drouetiella hepatica Uher 2000/2452 TaxID=904376 RepID=A0A951UN92_9CYAN|nr:MBL fold metallo-hydrolase [Drouetiella hepatica Uher 2000/2452]